MKRCVIFLILLLSTINVAFGKITYKWFFKYYLDSFGASCHKWKPYDSGLNYIKGKIAVWSDVYGYWCNDVQFNTTFVGRKFLCAGCTNHCEGFYFLYSPLSDPSLNYWGFCKYHELVTLAEDSIIKQVGGRERPEWPHGKFNEMQYFVPIDDWFLPLTGQIEYPFNGTLNKTFYTDFDTSFNFASFSYTSTCGSYSAYIKDFDGDKKLVTNVSVTNVPCYYSISFHNAHNLNSTYIFMIPLVFELNASEVSDKLEISYDVWYASGDRATYKFTLEPSSQALRYDFYFNGNLKHSDARLIYLPWQNGRYVFELVRWHRVDVGEANSSVEFHRIYPDDQWGLTGFQIPSEYLDYTYDNITDVSITVTIYFNSSAYGGYYEPLIFDRMAYATIYITDRFIFSEPKFKSFVFYAPPQSYDVDPYYVYTINDQRTRYYQGGVFTEVAFTHSYEIYAYVPSLITGVDIKLSINDRPEPSNFVTLTTSSQLIFSKTIKNYLDWERLYIFPKIDVANPPIGSSYTGTINILYVLS